MYRTSDAALAGAVNQRKADGDVDGMVAAAAELWRSEPEPGTPAEDPLELETWNNLVAAGAVAPAVRAAVGLLREGHKLRPRAFLHVVQDIRAFHDPNAERDVDFDQPLELTVADGELLLELADLVIARGWPRDPYLAIVFFKLIEGRAKRQLWPYMKERLTVLAADQDSWILVAVLAASTSLTLDLDEWLGDLPHRNGVPHWMVWLYMQHVHPRVPDAEAWAVAAAPDEDEDTETHRIDHQLEQALRHRRWDEFVSVLDGAPGHLERDPAEGLLSHPVLRYANRFKDGHRVTVKDFDYDQPVGLVATAQQGIRVNQGLVDLCIELGAASYDHVTVFRMFRQLFALEDKNAGRVLALWREFRKIPKPKSLAWATPAWERAVKSRSRWTTRLRYAIFG